MAKEPKTKEDFENMSDEDFLKLNEEDYSGNVPEGETSLTNEDLHDETPPDPAPEPEGETPDGTDASADSGESDESNDGDDPSTDSQGEGEENPDPEGTPDGEQDPSGTSDAGDSVPSGEQSETDTSEEEQETPDPETPDGSVSPESSDKGQKKADPKDTPAKAGYFKLPEGMDNAAMTEAVGFYQQLKKPFKADGKDFVVRSPEDAVRLMQQGVNYSRRMQEIKPMRQMHRFVQDNNLTQDKLNYAIDLLKGDKAAITQLLKSHKIDPMDLDTEKDSGYQATNYGGNSQDNAFRDALDEAIATPEGQALVSHIQADWDVQSKAKLRDDPSIVGNLTQLKASGVYDKVVEELRYQQSMGYLVGVPFLQAFDQVGEAMKNAGVFQAAPQPAPSANPMAPLNSGQPQVQPVASGARKPSGQKKPEANPHLSSTPPTKQSNRPAPKTPDFDKMSDEEFLKMAPPE